MESLKIKEVEVKSILSKSNLPVCEYSVNPYAGCTHACKYCYASFMKRFTGHTEDWGTFLDVKNWKELKNPGKYKDKELFIGSVTDPYNPQEETYGRTRALLKQLKGSGARRHDPVSFLVASPHIFEPAFYNPHTPRQIPLSETALPAESAHAAFSWQIPKPPT